MLGGALLSCHDIILFSNANRVRIPWFCPNHGGAQGQSHLTRPARNLDRNIRVGTFTCFRRGASCGGHRTNAWTPRIQNETHHVIRINLFIFFARLKRRRINYSNIISIYIIWVWNLISGKNYTLGSGITSTWVMKAICGKSYCPRNGFLGALTMRFRGWFASGTAFHCLGRPAKLHHTGPNDKSGAMTEWTAEEI